jgi:hypothetical protein
MIHIFMCLVGNRNIFFPKSIHMIHIFIYLVANKNINFCMSVHINQMFISFFLIMMGRINQNCFQISTINILIFFSNI